MHRFDSTDNEKWFNKFKMHRPILLTLIYNDYVRYETGELVKNRICKNHKHYLSALHNLTYKKSKKKIPRYVVIERGGKTKGLHSHIVIETPEHLSTSQYKNLCMNSKNKTKDVVEVHIENCYYKKGLDGYCSKNISYKSKNAEVDVENCHLQSH